MQTQNYLGLYISANAATAVCVAGDGGMLDCFTVTAEPQQEQKLQTMAAMIAQQCTEKNLKFSEVGVALDCGMYLQHSIRSEFTDARKIAQTVRFDAEEALTTDITEVAVAFKIDSAGKAGSQLTVFTAQRHLLSELLAALQAAALDPCTVEPDVNCLGRFICLNYQCAADSNPLFAVFSRHNGYYIIPNGGWQKGAAPPMRMRTFLLDASRNKTQMLAGQLPLTMATLAGDTPVSRIEIFDSASGVETERLSSTLRLETAALDLPGLVHTAGDALRDCGDATDFAVAYGAAVAHLDKPANMNFRSDFMPYQGKKMRLENALKFLSAAVVVLLLAAGLYGLKHVLRVNSDRGNLRTKLAGEYSDVMFGQKLSGDGLKKAADNLRSALRKTREAKEGPQTLTGEEAVSAKLTLVLQALNKYAAATNLNIESITVTGEIISVAGDTSSSDNTLKVFAAFRETGLEVLQQRISSEGGRTTFNITAEPKK